MIEAANAVETKEHSAFHRVFAVVAWREDREVKGSARRTPTDLGSLPPAPYWLLSPYRYVDGFFFRHNKSGLVSTARGRPYKCAYYWPYPLAYGSKVRRRNPEVVVEEIAVLRKE